MQSCCFIGYSDYLNEINSILYDSIEKLIINKNVKKFYVGTQGGFDRAVYETLCQLFHFV